MKSLARRRQAPTAKASAAVDASWFASNLAFLEGSDCDSCLPALEPSATEWAWHPTEVTRRCGAPGPSSFRPESGVSQHGKELRAVAFQFACTDTADGGQRLAVLRTLAQHRVQSGVVEDHVRRHALFPGEFRARVAQGIPQRLLVRGDLEAAAITRSVGATAGAALRAIGFLAQVNGFVAAQDRVRGRRQVQGSVAIHVGTQQAARDQLPEHAAPLARVELRADPMH